MYYLLDGLDKTWKHVYNSEITYQYLPPGDYTVEAWHEKLGKSTQKISVGPGGTKELEFVFKSTAGH